MDLRQLRFFLRVAEHGSLTRAAAHLSVGQPVLSRQIRDLEEELGVALLSRNGRGMVLTEAGKRFLPHARSLTQGADKAREEVRALRERPSGTVSIAMPPIVGATLWVPLLAEVRRKFPEIQLQLAEGYSGYVIEWLVHGKADIGVIYEPLERANIQHEPLISERLYLVGTPDSEAFAADSIPFDEMARLPLILPAMPHAIRRHLETVAAKRRVTLNVALEVNAYPAINSIVVAQRAFTVLPAAPVLAGVRSGEFGIAEITSPNLSQKVVLATSTHHPVSLGARTVCRMIKALVEKLRADGGWPARYVSK
jgi:LysR family transcriptional regulator, nitrogen assimilation regulatory protein